uniref:63-kDa periplasmic protein n=1 Tax=Holospora obtusa TaxID=49893 RepID=A5LI36_HOLOB|nr:63-kDa periplasmic protein [Holospora obtusa]
MFKTKKSIYLFMSVLYLCSNVAFSGSETAKTSQDTYKEITQKIVDKFRTLVVPSFENNPEQFNSEILNLHEQLLNYVNNNLELNSELKLEKNNDKHIFRAISLKFHPDKINQYIEKNSPLYNDALSLGKKFFEINNLYSKVKPEHDNDSYYIPVRFDPSGVFSQFKENIVNSIKKSEVSKFYSWLKDKDSYARQTEGMNEIQKRQFEHQRQERAKKELEQKEREKQEQQKHYEKQKYVSYVDEKIRQIQQLFSKLNTDYMKDILTLPKFVDSKKYSQDMAVKHSLLKKELQDIGIKPFEHDADDFTSSIKNLIEKNVEDEKMSVEQVKMYKKFGDNLRDTSSVPSKLIYSLFTFLKEASNVREAREQRQDYIPETVRLLGPNTVILSDLCDSLKDIQFPSYSGEWTENDRSHHYNPKKYSDLVKITHQKTLNALRKKTSLQKFLEGDRILFEKMKDLTEFFTSSGNNKEMDNVYSNCKNLKNNFLKIERLQNDFEKIIEGEKEKKIFIPTGYVDQGVSKWFMDEDQLRQYDFKTGEWIKKIRKTISY